MNEKLISWIKEVNPEPNEEYITKRENGIESWIKNFEHDDYLFLISTIFQKDSIDDDQMHRFTNAIKEHDELFVPSDSSREIQILASVAFAKLLEYNDNDSLILAISYLTTSFARSLEIIPQQNLYELSKYCLQENSLNNIIHIDEHVKIVNNKSTITQLKNDVKENPNLPASAFLETVLKLIENSVNSISSSNKIIEKLKTTNVRLNEEVDILWWAFSGVSSLLKKSFYEMTQNEATLLIGYELSEIIKVTPGPFSLDSIIKKQLSYCKEEGKKCSGLKNIITNLDDEFIKIIQNNFSNNSNLKLFLPIHDAIQRFEYAGRTGDWFSAFCKTCNIQFNEDMNYVDFAKQFNFECQLLNLLN